MKNLKRTFTYYCSKRISFIITTKDKSDHLDKALSSLANIKTKNDEVIVIDGDSKDDTINIFSKHSHIIDKMISEEDESGPHALNKGIILSSGKYIRQVTDDDIVYRDALDQAITILDRNEDIDLLVCGGIRKRNNIESPVYINDNVNYGENIDDPLIYGACGAGFIFRRSSIPKIGLMPIGPAADIELAVQSIARGGVVRFCRLNLFYHPIFEHSYTIKHADAWNKDIDKICQIYKIEKPLKFVKKEGIGYKSIFRPFYDILPDELKKYYHKIREKIQVEEKVVTDSETNKTKINDIIWDGGFS